MESLPTTDEVSTDKDDNRFSTILSILIIVYSILIAYVAYKSAEIASSSDDNYFMAQVLLSDANFSLIQANQLADSDFRMYDNYMENKSVAGADDRVTQAYFESISEAGRKSVKRSNDPLKPFDEAYYKELYTRGTEVKEEAGEKFIRGKNDSDRAVDCQLIAMILAVGLSFVAWASVIQKDKLRVLFIILSVLVMIAALSQMSDLLRGQFF